VNEHVFDHSGVSQAQGLVSDLGLTGAPRRSGAGPGPRPVAGSGSGALGALAERVRPTDLARDRRLPVLPAFADLLPGAGLRRGATVAVGAAPGVVGATSLALALAAGPSRAGSWVAVVGLGSLGLVAAAEMGVDLGRLVLVADPGRDRAGWASVVAALVDGFDVVLLAPGGVGAAGEVDGGGGSGPGRRLRPADARRLVARVRERGSVLLSVGGDLPGERSPLRLTVVAAAWEGLGDGWGHLEGRRVTVESGGRGEAARPRRAELWLPRHDGTVGTADPVVAPIRLRRERGVGA
jgi:hypothetical protein